MLAFDGVAGGYELFKPETLKVLCKKFCKVAPLRVIAWQQYRLAAEYIRIVRQICVYLVLDISILCIELIVLSFFRIGEVGIFCHSLILTGFPQIFNFFFCYCLLVGRQAKGTLCGYVNNHMSKTSEISVSYIPQGKQHCEAFELSI